MPRSIDYSGLKDGRSPASTRYPTEAAVEGQPVVGQLKWIGRGVNSERKLGEQR